MLALTGPKGRKSLLMAAAFIVVAAIAYRGVSQAELIWDDDKAIAGNEALRSAAGLADIWTHGPKIRESEVYYWPLVYTTFWMEYQLWGASPRGYHVTNVVLHVANALLLTLALGALGARHGWVAGLLFLVHPVHVESVVWVIERKDVL